MALDDIYGGQAGGGKVLALSKIGAFLFFTNARDRYQAAIRGAAAAEEEALQTVFAAYSTDMLAEADKDPPGAVELARAGEGVREAQAILNAARTNWIEAQQRVGQTLKSNEEGYKSVSKRKYKRKTQNK